MLANQLCRRLGAILLTLGLATALPAQVLINEVLFLQDADASIHEWIEIHNKGSQDVALDDWRIVDQNGDELLNLPDVFLPAGAYLVVHFSDGTDDLDFSDLQGSVYLGAGEVLGDQQGALALLDGPADPSNLRDFLAWFDGDGDYQPTGLDTLAWLTGHWPENQFVNTRNTWPGVHWKRQPVWVGTSIGRDRLSNDADQPLDWQAYGGKDALHATPGAANYGTAELVFQESGAGNSAEWTVMLYMAGENNLERALFEDLDELGFLGSNEDLNIVVQADFHPDYAGVQMTYDDGVNWIPTDAAIRGRLLGDEIPYRATIEMLTGTDPFLGEINMGDPAALANFIQWTKDNYPAQKYALVLWGNSGGWKYMNYDDLDMDALYMHELDAALEQAGVFFEVIGIDQSYGALLETAWQVAPYAEYLVASEENITQKGFNYLPVVETLRNVPAYNALDLSALIINSFGDYHDASGKHFDPWHTLSSIALDERLTTMAGHFSALAQELRLGMESGAQPLVSQERLNSLNFGDPNYIDLRNFVQNIDENAAIDAAWKTHAADVLLSAGDAVQHYRNGPEQASARGMSVYYPLHQTLVSEEGGDPFDDPAYSYISSLTDGQRARYAADYNDGTPYADPVNHPFPPAPGFRFADDFQWDEFLHRYYEPVAHAGADITVSVGAVLMLDGGASTCADGAIANWIWDFDATTDTDPTGDWNKNGIFNEPHDDNDAEGQTVLFPTNTPGQYIVVLTVWSDHHEMHHPDHWETDQDTIIVTVIDDFQIVDLLITDATCNGQNNGSAELILAGGQEPYTILWSNGQTGNPAIGLGAGSYSVTATDAMGVEVTQSFQISQPTPIEVAAEYTLPVCPYDSTGVISLTAQGGLPPYDYFWNTNDTGPTLSGVPAGIYFAFVIDAFGCVHTESFTLEASDNVPPVIIANDATVSLDPVTGTAIMQPSAFISQISDNCQIAGVNLTPLILDCSNIGPNTITIAAIDDSGNITVVQVVATIVDDTPPQMSPVNITLPLGADGTVTADPELLSGGSFDNCGIETLTIDIDFFDCGDVGDHLVVLTATDGSGNSSSAPAVITVVDNTPPTVITQNITVSLNANGQGFIVPSDLDGGSIDNCGILVLQASQTSYSCADLASGGPIPVTLTLYDISGNMGTGLAFVTVIDTIPPTIACPDDIVIPFCAPVTFDPPVADDNCDFSVVQTEGLPSGGVFPFGLTNQEFTATDTYGNTASCSFIVTVENDLDVEAEITHVSCNGLADGTIDLAVSGGTQPYLYFWSGGGNTNLSSGIYQVTILDGNGCESVRTYVVNEPNPLVLSVVNLQNETNGQGDGAFTLVVSGGTGPYTYEGTTFGDSLRVEDLSAGVYNLALTDANGCTISTSAEIQNISGVGEPQALRAFAVYPNPAGAFAVVDIRFSQASRIQLSLSDASGRTIQTWAPPVAADQLNLRIELDEVPPGMYTLKLVAEDGVAVRKLIKN